MKKIIVSITSLLSLAASAVFGTNLANPTVPIPEARLSVGASYFVGGSTITNDSLPMIANRFGTRVSYAPINFVSFGLDLGTSQISVERYVRGGDTIPVFNSGVGWSVGGHVKVSSPVMLEYVSVFGIANGNFFRAGNDLGAYYGGKEGVGVVGAQMRIPGFGSVSIGPQLYLIMGDNRPYNSKKTNSYSNMNNVRGWIAVDYFPEMSEMAGENKPYATLEFSVSPKINGSRRAPIQEFSIALSVGVITKRLYGEDLDVIDF